MPSVDVPLVRNKFGETSRRELWWVQPIFIVLGFSTFLIYANWAAWQGNHYEWGPYLSPFYSPLLFGDSRHAWFGMRPEWIPAWVSPALLILWVPGGFRFTCYYYRGAYYKAFWADPPSCAVGEPRNKYLGEHSFPLVLQNLHRFALFLAIAFIFILAYDVYNAVWFKDAAGNAVFGIGLGTLVLASNVVLLSCYIGGCHSFRHLIGGRLDVMSGKPVRKQAYDCVSCLNRRHMLWAWLSLFSVGFSDVYVRLCSMNIWTDWRIL